ncbi:protein with a bacterial immunoglobulin-like domain [Legionella steigerwaltii]|uniref:Protein with a bacterial immunoglobulin-like domain n=1 Tax=Legionella steigerwaltii TaxID=460 RepID=A0A378L926_9GAMM|nr:Ig-like domain-containing protein [Legionella steigerwaltii]KTD77530.1 protein with a bacterial immunoglobulin-like domain protein [Legionella steigerwaltii]STY22840.1 protein with a bacterial immunoglobulin-like domain [Legionella steigerwaltii]
MKSRMFINKLLTGVVAFLMMAVAYAGTPLWTFTPDPQFPPKVSVSSTGTATVKYTVTNKSKKKHTLVIQPQEGVSQTQPCQLEPKGSSNSSCTLTLTITGSALPSHGISGGPVLCQTNPDGTPNPSQCYQPSLANSLNITISTATLVSLTVNPPNAQVVQGTTQQFTAMGIFSDASSRDLTSSVTWSSSNNSIATVSNTSGSNGLANGITSGTATITAISGSVSGTAYLNVTNATLVSIAVTPANPSISQGTTKQFIATGAYSDGTMQNITSSVTWSSSNNSIATISNAPGSNGLATGVSVSSTAITITATMGAVSGNTGLTVVAAPLTTLTSSITSLTLSVNDSTNAAALTGTPRRIFIINSGFSPAINVTYSLSSALPMGSSISPLECGDIPARGTCELTITPGSMPTVASITLTVSGGNTNTLTPQINILTYASVYQGGYVFSVDDTTPDTGSISGKVASLVDQASSIIWSSNSSGTYDGGISIWGIADNSTATSPSPNATSPVGQTATQYTGQLNCAGKTDGSCDTNNIYVYYQNDATNAPINLSYYAAGLCKEAINGYADWYLPAICEMGYGFCGFSTNPTLQNMQSNLVDFNNLHLLSGSYWSSTEFSSIPQTGAFLQIFNFSGGTQRGDFKNVHYGVRCVRGF